ncbi:nitrate reductase molybdenum cofactor assembly chaperone [Arsukibacterium indicum]|uniref:Nitrate reductase molybdenum cofactor assembly chaperone n=1 Tax=Arsukibacterium indicum TaxID=2848612 RepID=A0ABS6MFS8_9GAMM|nr:nitrate reductase molybdenum cofactor assembly chaperone [Arsukibacterium indicum]MBV2127585.1 nitrate reductase molybdenum cofactor assembly chaperone [Arsukibacterium indicum]
MDIIRVISLLLDYPELQLQQASSDLLAIVRQADISAKQQLQLTEFINERSQSDIMDWQSEYDGLFERGRSLSLLLFEHLHGESRDRGQAMVDLMQQYQQAGLDIGVRELPDYIPLYLEFLATQGEENARLGLAEVAHILSVLQCRLEQRNSNYQALFAALLELSGVQVELEPLREQLKAEKPDHTNEALDKVWEEEMVTFGPGAENDGCATSSKPSETQRRDQYVPMQWTDATKPANTNIPSGV